MTITNNHYTQRLATALATLLAAVLPTHAQLSANPDKFLGNITTSWNNDMDYAGFTFSDYWNQVTAENATKWEQVEGTRGQYNWWGADKAANYARQHNMPFKFHTLVWGSQFPGWLRNLSAEERYDAIVKWMDAVKKHYPDLVMIDVVNEAVEGHQGETYLMREALGGAGATGYDWIVRAFEMAAERWPDAILIYNDFNTFQYDTDKYIELVRTLRDAGAPIDAYGCQSHELGGMNGSSFGASMRRIHDALQMPMYITEYDIPDANDGNQKWNFQQHIPLMWEADYCAGVTLWGWHYGQTWTQDGNSGLIRNGKERSALTWLREYMATDKAKTARSPFPGMVKEASVYVKPSALRVSAGASMTIDVTARLRTKTVSKVELYVNGELVQSLTSAPYTYNYTPASAGAYALRAVVTATDGSQWERHGGFTAVSGFVPQPGVTAAVDHRYTSLAEIGSEPFAIVSETDGKALFGAGEQNLGYDDFQTAFTANAAGYLFRLESLKSDADASVRDCHLLRLVTPAGADYDIWGKPGYLNSQPAADGWCSFILGLTKGNGEDMQNGAVWDIEYVAGRGFTLRNVGTGLYLHDAGPASHAEPAYFTFCSLKAADASGVEGLRLKVEDLSSATGIYDLQGRRVNLKSPTSNLKSGIYIVNGKKVVL